MTAAGPTHEPGTALVHVIDDDEAVRTAIEDLLASVGLSVRSYGSTRAFLEAAPVDGPACLVLDIRMPGQSGLEFQQQMARTGLRLPVIFITGHGDIAMSVKAMKNGAIEFLTKPFRDQDLLDAIQHGIEKDRLRLEEDEATATLQACWRTLSPGERDVLPLVVRGLLNKQIAGLLDVSEITVKVRRSQVMRKMQAKSVADLVRIWDRLQPKT
ncbi:response regulator transcription factor [Labrys monachus]|uniref:FixJ family two-component response regulator n=1 Tax=Labrys monachus TaxID=217067 RepID=A0ABU0FLV0_9HYPH|nr:response regulator transcription factor [Labrys monachus]MDQ0395561.1 FixJ family two-component response regulator [Labrys monachus]